VGGHNRRNRTQWPAHYYVGWAIIYQPRFVVVRDELTRHTALHTCVFLVSEFQFGCWYVSVELKTGNCWWEHRGSQLDVHWRLVFLSTNRMLSSIEIMSCAYSTTYCMDNAKEIKPIFQQLPVCGVRKSCIKTLGWNGLENHSGSSETELLDRQLLPHASNETTFDVFRYGVDHVSCNLWSAFKLTG